MEHTVIWQADSWPKADASVWKLPNTAVYSSFGSDKYSQQ